MTLLLLLGACTGGAPVAEPYALQQFIQGPAGIGYGHALAYVGNELAVGSPADPTGGHVELDGVEVLRGQGPDFLGSALLGGDELLIAAPRFDGGRGAILALDGSERLAGTAGQGLGSRPVRHEGGLAAITASGVFSDGELAWEESVRLWALASVELPESTLVGGRVDGRLSVAGEAIGVANPTSELGYSLASCQLEGQDWLVVGEPGRDRVRFVETLTQQGLSSAAIVEGPPGSRFGHALLCTEQGLFVGAPSGAGVHRALGPSTGLDWSFTLSGPRQDFAFSLAAATDGTLAVGAPGASRVYLFSPRQ